MKRLRCTYTTNLFVVYPNANLSGHLAFYLVILFGEGTFLTLLLWRGRKGVTISVLLTKKTIGELTCLAWAARKTGVARWPLGSLALQFCVFFSSSCGASWGKTPRSWAPGCMHAARGWANGQGDYGPPKGKVNSWNQIFHAAEGTRWGKAEQHLLLEALHPAAIGSLLLATWGQ